MTQLNGMLRREIKASDAIVDGLFRGVVAGLAMLVVLALAGLTYGDSPLGVVARFDPAGGEGALVGLLAHLAVSGIYGALFGLLSIPVLRRASRPAWAPLALGAVYGLLLALVAHYVLLPGVESPLLGIPMLQFSLGHLLYGLILGFFASKSS